MKEYHAEIFQKKIGELEGYNPPSTLWGHIEDRLEFERVLKEKQKQLPGYVPKDGWEQLNCRLGLFSKRISGGLKKTLWIAGASGIAASILLFMSVWHFYSPPQKDTLLFSEEVNEIKTDEPSASSDLETQAVKFIKMQCYKKPFVCSSDEFRDRLGELDNVSTQLQDIEAMERRAGSSDMLIKSKIKLINYKAVLIRQLIKNTSLW
jgi:hypothetical protein